MSNRKRKIVISLASGMLAALLLGGHRGEEDILYAWWGFLYPQYCYQQIEGEYSREEVKIKIKSCMLPDSMLEWRITK